MTHDPTSVRTEPTHARPVDPRVVTPTLSVVIPCLNAADTLGAQLDALAAQQVSEPWEVIVVDNGSVDATREVAGRHADRLCLRIVDASERHSNPYAMNRGIQAARGDLIAICDADDEVAPGWISAMVDALRTHPFVAGRHEGQKLNATSWIARGQATVQEQGLQPYREWPGMAHAGSGNMGFRREVVEAHGAFDERFRALADTELCFRLQHAGVPLAFAGDAVVHVRRRDTLRGAYRQGRSFGEYSVALYDKFRQVGMPSPGWQQLRAWLALGLGAVRTLWRPATLPSWVWSLGWRVGRLRGTVHHRVLAL